MSHFHCLFLSIFFLLQSSAVTAGVFADDLGKCLVNSTTAADRKLLSKWVFFSLASNHEFKEVVSISDAQREDTDKRMAMIVERLLTVSCRLEAKQALKHEGDGVLESSFQILGAVANRELSDEPNVSSSLTKFAKYIDSEKLSAALSSAPKSE